jgi:R3H domain
MVTFSAHKIIGREIVYSKQFVTVHLKSIATLLTVRLYTSPVALSCFYVFPGRKKEINISEELRHQWVRDRAKKAERKQLRALERAAAAADPFAFHKGGKKSRKAGIAAALAVPMDLETVVKRMRRFVADINGTNTLSLPSMDREMRKSVHELANAFKLKSKSRGTGVMRFTTLMKTSHSGGKVDEKKIAWILRGSPPSYVDRKNKGGAGKRRLHDGEVVGEVMLVPSVNRLLYTDDLLVKGRAKVRRVEPRVPYAICYGLGRGQSNWSRRRAGGPFGGCHQNHQIRPRGEQSLIVSSDDVIVLVTFVHI